jgi:hypothetical protein
MLDASGEVVIGFDNGDAPMLHAECINKVKLSHAIQRPYEGTMS